MVTCRLDVVLNLFWLLVWGAIQVIPLLADGSQFGFDRSLSAKPRLDQTQTQSVHKSYPLRPSGGLSKAGADLSMFALFSDVVKEIVSTVPDARFCRLVQYVVRDSQANVTSVVDELNVYRVAGSIQHERAVAKRVGTSNSCAHHWRSQPDSAPGRTRDVKTAVDSQLLLFYNALPFPFQCHVLYRVSVDKPRSVTGQRFPRTRHMSARFADLPSRSKPALGRSESRRPSLSVTPISSISDISKVLREESVDTVNVGMAPQSNDMNLLLGWLLQSTESDLKSEKAILPVAAQCGSALMGERSYAGSLRLSLMATNDEAVQQALNQLKSMIPEIFAAFVLKYDLEIPGLLEGRAKQMASAVWVAQFTRPQLLPRKTVVDLQLHLMAKRVSVSANLLLASIYDFGVKTLQEAIAMPLKIRIAKTAKFTASGNQSFPKLDDLFPAYLDCYFKSLPTKQKCSLLRILASHAEVKLETALQSLAGARHLSTSGCNVKLPEVGVKKKNEGDNATRVTHPTISSQRFSLRYIKKPPLAEPRIAVEDRVYSSRATTVEIIMIVILSILLVLSLVFLSTCLLFVHRQRVVTRALLRRGRPPFCSDSNVDRKCARHVEYSPRKRGRIGFSAKCDVMALSRSQSSTPKVFLDKSKMDSRRQGPRHPDCLIECPYSDIEAEFFSFDSALLPKIRPLTLPDTSSQSCQVPILTESVGSNSTESPVKEVPADYFKEQQATTEYSSLFPGTDFSQGTFPREIDFVPKDASYCLARRGGHRASSGNCKNNVWKFCLSRAAALQAVRPADAEYERDLLETIKTNFETPGLIVHVRKITRTRSLKHIFLEDSLETKL